MNRFFSILCIATLTAFTACDTSELTSEGETSVTIAGTISGSMEPTLVKVHRFDTELQSDSALADGAFKLQLEANDQGLYTLFAGQNMAQVYLEPGDSIHVSLQLGGEAAIWSFGGSKSDEAGLLYAIERLVADEGMKDFPGPWVLAYPEYSAKRDSVATAVRALIDGAKQEGKLDDDFAKALQIIHTNYTLQYDLMYPMYHGYFNESSEEPEGYDREELMRKVDQMEVNEPLALEFGSIKNVMEARLEAYMEATMDSLQDDPDFEMDEETYYDLTYKAPSVVFENQEVLRDFFTFEQYRQLLTYGGPNNAATYRDDLHSRGLCDTYMGIIDIIEQRWEPIMPGKEVPDFAFVDRDSSEVRLSDFRGKLVYIDMWATWCGPCIQEHPHWEELKNDYQDAPIAFVAVSIDNNPAPWIKMLADKNMEGNHLYAQGAWNSAIAKHFMVNSIPRFLLLDTEGKVLDPNAARPSSKIRDVFEAHLEELS